MTLDALNGSTDITRMDRDGVRAAVEACRAWIASADEFRTTAYEETWYRRRPRRP